MTNRAYTYFISIIFLLIPLHISVQNSTIRESLPIESSALGETVHYNIYLPAGYEESNRSYPVLYLLHGYTDNEIGWTKIWLVTESLVNFVGSV